MAPLPALWQQAFQREADGRRAALADPLPERRLARLLGAFILVGLGFMVLPGTLLGVWNLLEISSHRSAEAVSRIWIQAHGHAQLFGWVGTFMIGISLYTVPKFRGGRIRSLAAGWAMLGLWTAVLAARWAAAIWAWQWRVVWPAAAAIELAVALLLIWQCTGPAGRRSDGQRWTLALIFAGLLGLALTFAVQLISLLPPPPVPLIPAGRDSLLLHLALWAFCFPVAWGFSGRLLPSFLGLRKPDARAAWLGLAALAAGAALTAAERQTAGAVFTLAAALAACWSLRIFHPPVRAPKVSGVDRRYPWFVRVAFAWLAVSAALGFSVAPGMVGASRHAFTVGFLALLIFSIGPRILPAFLNSRELWSRRLMLAAMVLLAGGCLLRVGTEPLAYGGVVASAWLLLTCSALMELAAVLLFAVNIGMTLASPVPAWIVRRTINADLTLYWCVSSYPATRRLLIEGGLKTLATARQIPRTLTLAEAAQAEGLDPMRLLERLREYFERRLAKALKPDR